VVVVGGNRQERRREMAGRVGKTVSLYANR